jgi:plasmid stabilization system protein ParE
VEVKYHPLVKRDVLEILRYYHEISSRLADEFHDELQVVISQAAENSQRFPSIDKGFRRANLKRFPHHLLYEIRDEAIRVMVVRHNKRHPEFGLQRK